MEMRHFVKMLNMKYEDLEKACGLEVNYFKNRRYRQVHQLNADIAVILAETLNLDFYKLLELSKNENRVVDILFDKTTTI